MVLGKENKLSEKLVERTETEAEGSNALPSDSANTVEQDHAQAVSANRRTRRPHAKPAQGQQADLSAPSEMNGNLQESEHLAGAEDADAGGRRVRRNGRGERDRRPRAPRAESASSTIAQDDADSFDAPAETAVEGEAAGDEGPLTIDLSGREKRATRTAARARRKQQVAKAAVESFGASEGDHPALGALNRHLNVMMHQLATAHRVIGRVAAERDALRQQLAELQGVPIEEIVVSTIGISSEQTAKTETPSATPEAPEKSFMSRLNYFGGEDVAVMRRRRQSFVLGIIVFIVGLWVAARMGAWTMPDKISRDSLAQLPYIGDLMAVVLAGWMLFRLVRVSSKGVRWVFPSEDQKRRRR